MWVIYLIAGAFFVACIAIGYFGVRQTKEDGERGLGSSGAGLDDGEKRALTSDEVVLRLEQRIDEDVREISYDLGAPERFARLYER